MIEREAGRTKEWLKAGFAAAKAGTLTVAKFGLPLGLLSLLVLPIAIWGFVVCILGVVEAHHAGQIGTGTAFGVGCVLSLCVGIGFPVGYFLLTQKLALVRAVAALLADREQQVVSKVVGAVASGLAAIHPAALSGPVNLDHAAVQRAYAGLDKLGVSGPFKRLAVYMIKKADLPHLLMLQASSAHQSFDHEEVVEGASRAFTEKLKEALNATPTPLFALSGAHIVSALVLLAFAMRMSASS